MPERETDELFTKFEELITTLTDFNKNALHLKPTLIAIQDALTVQNARLDALEHRTDLLRRDAMDARIEPTTQQTSTTQRHLQNLIHIQKNRLDLLDKQLTTIADLSAQLDIDFRTHHHQVSNRGDETGTPICEN